MTLGTILLIILILILIGAVAMTKFQRVYESAILRTLGASTRLLTTTLALEYCALGLLAGTIGAAGALGLSWGVTRYVFDISWRPVPGLLTIGALLMSAGHFLMAFETNAIPARSCLRRHQEPLAPRPPETV